MGGVEERAGQTLSDDLRLMKPDVWGTSVVRSGRMVWTQCPRGCVLLFQGGEMGARREKVCL